MLTVRRGIPAALVLLTLLSTAASAEYKPTAAQRAACTSDAFKLCSAHLANMDRMFACLMANKSQLSAGCRKQAELIDSR
jgi:hypothetical protein